MEALTLECFQTARFFDVENEIKASLDHSFPGMGWCEDRVDYWFERANTHGLRRAEEMREVAKQVLKVCLQQIALRHSQKTIVQ